MLCLNASVCVQYYHTMIRWKSFPTATNLATVLGKYMCSWTVVLSQTTHSGKASDYTMSLAATFITPYTDKEECAVFKLYKVLVITLRAASSSVWCALWPSKYRLTKKWGLRQRTVCVQCYHPLQCQYAIGWYRFSEWRTMMRRCII